MKDFDARIEALQSELLKRRAHTMPWGRWSAYQHGMATFRILEAWDRPKRTQLVGLALAAAGFADERDFVRDLIGEDADRLARLVRSAGAPTVVTATSGDDPSDVGEANAIHLASLAGSSCAEDGSPGRWLPLASQLAAAVRRLAAPPPQPFSGGTELVSKAAEATLVGAYRRVTRSMSRPDAAAQAALADAARAVPWVAEPLVILGLMRLAEADASGAVEYGTRASEILLSWNCAWDKRLSEFAWYALTRFLQGQDALADDERAFSAQRMVALLEKHGASPCDIFAHLDAVGVLEPLTQSPDDDGVTVYEGGDGDPEDHLDDLEFDQLPTRFQSYVARLSDDDPVLDMETYPSLSARPWWDPDDVAVAQTIAELADDVFAELQADERFQGHAESSALLVRSANTFPTLARLLAEQRNVVAATDGIRLIRVEPASPLVGGRAASNLRLRCIVAVDGGAATVVVDDVADTLQRGDCLVFDPAFPHEFRPAGDGPATMLCVDIWHPELTPSEVQLLAGFARYVRDLASARQQPSADPTSATND